MNTTATYPDKQFPDTLTFADALRFNDSELTEHLLRKGLQPNSRTADGKPLLLAAQAAHADNVEWALEKAGATEDFYTEEERQEAALHREPLYCGRADWQHRPLLELCREQMQEAEAQGDGERLANLRDRERRLTFQAPVFNESAFQTLLADLSAKGIEVPDLDEWPENRRKPTSRAMAAMEVLLKNGDAYWLKRLLDTGVNPNDYMYADDGYYELPLCEAIQCSPSLVPLLLEYGADPSGNGGDEAFPLFDALYDYDEDASDELIEMLLAAGANPFIEKWNGSTPLLEAVVNKRYQLVTRLLNLGVNTNPSDAEDIWTLPLVQAISDADVGLVRELLDAGASPFLIPDDGFIDDWDGQSPLYVAENEYRWSARLPYREAEDKRRRKHGRRVLESIYERYPDIDRLPGPPRWNVEEAEKIPYFSAMLWNSAAYGMRENSVNLLRDHATDPNACNRAGIPALVIAAVRGHTETVYELLCYGATPELPPHLLTATGCTGEVNEEIVQLIRRFKGA